MRNLQQMHKLKKINDTNVENTAKITVRQKSADVLFLTLLPRLEIMFNNLQAEKTDVIIAKTENYPTTLYLHKLPI